jgi:hypothetical protein
MIDFKSLSKKRPALITLLCGLLSLAGLSQETTGSPYDAVDSFVQTVKYQGKLDSLTLHLTAPYDRQLLKARAIFKWITENIAYDYKYINKHGEYGDESISFECSDENDCEAKRTAWETRYIDRVLRRKKAVCMGYSMLFKRMCDFAGLRAQMLPGYVRTEDYQVGTPGTLNHAWNSIYIDSTYYLLDATWAAGGCIKDPDDDGKLLGFVKQFNPYYWLTLPEDFARNHYPSDTMWTLVPLYTKEKFMANPWYRSRELPHIHLVSPATGIIHAKKGDTLHFVIECPRFDMLQMNSNVFRNPDIYERIKIGRHRSLYHLDTLAVKMQQYVSYRREDRLCKFDYVVTDATLYYLDILFDHERIMRFNVTIAL